MVSGATRICHARTQKVVHHNDNPYAVPDGRTHLSTASAFANQRQRTTYRCRCRQLGTLLVGHQEQRAIPFRANRKYDPGYALRLDRRLRVVNITGDLVEHPTKAAIYSRQEVPADLRDYVNSALTEAVRQEKFRRYNIPELNNIINDIQQTIDVATVRWTDEGEQESLTDIATVVGMFLTFLIYMFVLSYGAMVMQSVIEEKTNRIVEVMVSSIKPLQLLFGKIIGVGLVGLFQMLIWGLLLSAIVGIITAITGVGADPTAAATDEGAMQLFNQLSTLPVAEIAILFVLYFIGGYLLYASMLAAFGAAVNDQQDSGQFMMPVMLVMIFAFYAGFYGAQNPEGPLAFWTSFIPFTSSIVMMVRIPFGVPFYQIVISVVTLYATVFAMLWISAKIYRVGILIYGKKPSFKDFYKWLKY